MTTEIVSHIESNAESNVIVMVIFENGLTKQVNSVPLIMAHIKFSAEFSKVES